MSDQPKECIICDKRLFDDLVYCQYSETIPSEMCDMFGREPGADDGLNSSDDGVVDYG